jgi:predicted sulfurtransferase/23S rRNA-/tRNA-specific pseudouridylate synthase
MSAPDTEFPPPPSRSISIILFYKYHPLSDDSEQVELYRSALEILCSSLSLKGRILVGCNRHRSEGINGTLSGQTENLRLFVRALEGPKKDDDFGDRVVQEFWMQCQDFYQQARCPPLTMEESEFKWSCHCGDTKNDNELFPDLNIKMVKELIGTGGVLAQIPLEEIHQGYLTPKQWHERVKQYNSDPQNDTILIDCRNTKECQIGHFQGATDPQTTTFNQFTQWVKNHQPSLEHKKVLMYCTGGIRCEKASAYIRRTVPNVQEVRHLKGGIHKYLEEFGNDKETESMWKGKNFVFDGRGAHGPPGRKDQDSERMKTIQPDQGDSSKADDVVGECRYCNDPYDNFHPHCVCTVCREPTLICQKCQDSQEYHEYHCRNHQHLQECYFTDLRHFTEKELQQQLEQLHTLVAEIAVGKKFRARRKTLLKQCEKIQERMKEIARADASGQTQNGSDEWKCRNCGDIGCSGRCWGFHSLKRKRLLQEQQKTEEESSCDKPIRTSGNTKTNRRNEQIKEQKEARKNQELQEWIQLGLVQPPHVGRNPETGIRVPSPCTRILETTTKAKWCGKPLVRMMQTEFPDLVATNNLSTLFQNGLIRVNNKPVEGVEQAESLLLKNMDVIGRVLHWHEPPVILETDRISLQRIDLPNELFPEGSGDDRALFICNKPSTVPVHPAGPYLANSMTIMLEGQEGFSPKSLIPCHRIDRVTSGLTLCCTNPQVARLVQSTIAQSTNNRSVRKHYIAKVHGKFPCSETNAEVDSLPACSDLGKWIWLSKDEPRKVLQVDAPIETVDPANGIRSITPKGKPSSSHFYLIEYDREANTSIISCSPVTGRSHQLRVHLQWLGYPIVDDVQYGGDSSHAGTLVGVESIKASVQQDLKQNSRSYLAGGISEEDVQAARGVCSTCVSGPEASFSAAQLLKEGHAICLHALRYQLTLTPVGKTNRKMPTDEMAQTADESIRHSVDARVGLPQWAAHLKL